MSRKASHRAGKHTAGTNADGGGRIARFWLGTFLIVVAVCAAGLLVLEHLVGIGLPGCGPASGCASAAKSVWGKVPGLGWPVSMVGLAYFLAALAGWGVSRGRLAGGMRGVAAVGGAVSAGFIVVSVVTGLMCPYCLVANGANLAFACVAVLGGRVEVRGGARWALPAGMAVFMAVGGVLLTVEAATRDQVMAREERERAESAAKMVARAQEERAAGGSETSEGAAGAGATGAEQTAVSGGASKGPEASAGGKPFTGRWRRGPERAAVRVVVLTDYQCPDCKIIEKEIEDILGPELAAGQGGGRMSLSIKHFPMCADCNPRMGKTLHANACWAARAAEAAGILYGQEGYWKMHDWLFARGGAFTDAELDTGLAQLGFERGAFLAVMQSKGTLDRVKEDVAEGWELGLHRTPMIFVNGVELKGWMSPRAVTRTLQEVLASNPPVAGPEKDRPMGAMEKYIADWRDERVRDIPVDPNRPVLGAADAKVRVVVWGDLQEPGTCEADAYLRALAASGRGVRYEYRHYPVSKACNPVAQVELFPMGCLAAKAAEAGRFMFGNDGYWRVQEWLVNNRARLSEQALRDGLPALAMEGDEFWLTMEFPEIARRIEEDARAGQALGIASLPAIYVDGKLVPRWKRDGESVLPRILEAAGVR